MKALDINSATWEDTAADRATWRSTLKQHLKTGQEKPMDATAAKRALRKERSTSDKPETTYKCDLAAETATPTLDFIATNDVVPTEQPEDVLHGQL